MRLESFSGKRETWKIEIEWKLTVMDKTQPTIVICVVKKNGTLQEGEIDFQNAAIIYWDSFNPQCPKSFSFYNQHQLIYWCRPW